MRFVGRGHPAVRASHDKTLELSPDTGITERATCIVSVATTVDPARPMAGPIRLTISAGGEQAEVDAVANPGWDPAGPAVVRRSPVRTAGTFATEATRTAADLPRPLVQALRDPDVEVVVDVAVRPGPDTVVLVALDPLRTGPDRALLAEFAAADLVVAQDPTAAAVLGERTAHGQVTVSGRVLVAAAQDLPGAAVVDDLGRVRVETMGLLPAFAAAAAAPSRGPLVLPGPDVRGALLHSPAGARIVVTTTADRVPELLGLATEVLGQHRAVLAGADRPPVTVTGSTTLPGRDPVAVCICATAAGVDPAVRTAVAGLLADGVPTKVAARALATLTGEPQRRAYDTVLGLRGDPSAT